MMTSFWHISQKMLQQGSTRCIAMLLAFMCNMQFLPASPGGSLFAGAVRPSGYAFFWNPASLNALSEGLHTSFDLYGQYLNMYYDKYGTHYSSGEEYKRTEFTYLAPDFGFSISLSTPIPWLRFIFGGFTPRAMGANYPDDTAQRYHIKNGYLISYALQLGVAIKPSDTFGLALAIGPTYSRANYEQAFDFGAYLNDSLGSNAFPVEDPLFEGNNLVQADGWSAYTSFGLWYHPVQWWTLGLGGAIELRPQLKGTVNMDIPQWINDGLPEESQIKIHGDMVAVFPCPWYFTIENEFKHEAFSLALLYQFQYKRGQRLMEAEISNAEPDPLNSIIYLVTGTRHDHNLALRLSYHIQKDLELGLRFDYNPNSIPEEMASAVNIDMDIFETTLGANWQFSDAISFTLNYAYIYTPKNIVENSLYSSYADFSTGLQFPEVDGEFQATAHRVIITSRIHWNAL